ncbi:MAP3K4 [Mytilus coruscus]|uniref:Mitogen-activated protein kinase kinase kinase 4 n=1 Tax=Mytilus coruscus TaxID=42192 RepID=A0A6J8DMT1_MYTCO|nr:MAP3K4 [Mytilus coruscus]
MAADGTKYPRSASPNEDYNPLHDETEAKFFHQQSHDADISEEEDQFNSVESLPENMYSNLVYGTTPPAHPRGAKLEKSKKHSHQRKVSYKEYMATKKKPQPRTPVNIIKDQYADNPVFCKLSGVDSDDNLERDFSQDSEKMNKDNRNNKKKILKTSRSYDRHVKATSGDLSNLDTNTADVSLTTSGRFSSTNPPRVDFSGRFSSLINRPSPLTITLTNSLNLSCSLNSSWGPSKPDSRRLSVVCPDCPKDRSDFYKIFSALIQMGSQPKKEKDHKRKDNFGAYRRQISSEQELWQQHFVDYLWLELRMEHLGYTSFKDFEDNLKLEKARILQVLEDIMNFKLDNKDFIQLCDIPVYKDASHDLSSPEILSCENNSITTETISFQKLAVSQVEELLDKLDQCEQLFPTSKAFAKEYPQYGSKEFTLQVKSLYLWLNITRDLCHKMKQLGKMLGVQYIPDIDWPMMDFESPRWHETKTNVSFHRESIPEIRESDSSESEDEGIANNKLSPGDSSHSTKRVTFTMGSGKASPTNDVPKDTSTPLKPSIRYYSTSSTDLSRVSSEASIMDDFAKTTTFVYRKFVDKTLKRMGMNKMLLRFRELFDRTLQRAQEALQKPSTSSAEGQSPKSSGDDANTQMSTSPAALDFLCVQDFPHNTAVHRSSSITDCGACSEQFQKMGLPSFRPSYLFLLQVFMDVIHEALRLRLDQRPMGEPSHLSIRPLLRECKDVLQGAVIVKQYYQHMVYAVFAEEEMMDLEQFDQDLRKMLDEYLTYLQTWLYMLQNLPEASRSLKNVLDTEWTFTKGICPYIIGGEAEAGKRFSTLASSLLNSIVDFMETGIDDFTASLYDWTMRDDEDEDLDENGDEYADEEDENESNAQYIRDTDDDSLDPTDCENSRDDHVKRIMELRHSFQQTSRNCKKLFNEARERATKALGFAKILRKDLEIAADFNIIVNTAELFDKLKETNHALVMASMNPGYQMFIPNKIINNQQLILQLLNVTCGRDDVSRSQDDPNKEDGYLLMVKCEGGRDHKLECPIWVGNSVKVEPTAETTIALSHIEVQGLLLVVINAGHLTTQRKEFEGYAGKTVELVNEQTSCHQAIAESLAELKSAAVELQEKVVLAIKQVDEKLNFEDIANLEDNEKYHLLNLYRETMLKGYNFGFEYLKEVTRLVTGEPRQKLGTRLVSFAKQWMQFVMEKCDKGRGMRPKWASHGLDFLTVACQPVVLAGLTEQEFQDLKHSINNCISHVIGSADRNIPTSPTHGGSMHSSRSSSSDFGGGRSYMRFPSWPTTESPIKRSTSQMSTKSADGVTSPLSAGSDTRSSKRSSIESMPEVESCIYDGEDGGLILDISHRRRSRGGSCDFSHEIIPLSEKATKKIKKLEEDRTKKLQEQRVIGREVSKKSETDYRINVRRVNFRWQRGLKIGEGQFGKVYSAVNMDTGDLMAMKEMKFQANDHQALKEIADEIIMFEGIQHLNLIKYYGVEVHRDEMLIFMEYCDRGTLEEASKMGLPEHLMALYAKEILKAIGHLHEFNIVHRDIKGANVFLTSEGCLKLGDFGCSAKLKSQQTMPGEFNNIVGTTAYMAPEVITKSGSGGHGRAADIWSLGCVIIEMATGKRPWHELENNYQIMFKVGMGSIPSIPETLSYDGKDFVSHCLEPDPEIRWTAAQLIDHPFVKVQMEEPDGDS